MVAEKKEGEEEWRQEGRKKNLFRFVGEAERKKRGGVKQNLWFAKKKTFLSLDMQEDGPGRKNENLQSKEIFLEKAGQRGTWTPDFTLIKRIL